MVNIKKYIVLSVIWILDTVDIFLRLFGIKICSFSTNSIIGSLTAEELEETKQKDVARPFQVFLKGLEQDENLALVQRFFLRRQIKHAFQTRVEINQALQQKPEIREIPIRRPIFIVGMPRTGTTLLSRLMGQDPRLRAPLLWEMASPCPPGKVENFREDRRYQMCKLQRDLMNWLMGDDVAKRVHLCVADEPEECLTFTRLQFWQYFNFLRIPALHEHEDWFLSEGTDHEYCKLVYQYYKKQLQLLSYQHDQESFLLKCNVHLLALDALREVFPDACFIYTYRPMSEALASFCSTMDLLFSYWGPVDKKYGKRILRLCSELTNRGVKFFEKYDKLPAGQTPMFFANFKELSGDPLKMVTNIYNHFGIPLTEEAANNFSKYIKEHPRNKHGKHNYSLAKYGLTVEDLHREMAPYVEYFKKKGLGDAI